MLVFVWKKSSSPIAHFGGMSGVRQAYRILSDFMGIDDKTTESDNP